MDMGEHATTNTSSVTHAQDQTGDPGPVTCSVTFLLLFLQIPQNICSDEKPWSSEKKKKTYNVDIQQIRRMNFYMFACYSILLVDSESFASYTSF